MGEREADYEQLFEDYRRWYQSDYLQFMAEEGYFEDVESAKSLDWYEPFSLRRLTASDLREIESSIGVLPLVYKKLLESVGVGRVLTPDEDDEPVAFSIVHPLDAAKRRSFLIENRAALSADPEWKEHVEYQSAQCPGGFEHWLPVIEHDVELIGMLGCRSAEDDELVLLWQGEGFENGRARGARVSMRSFWEQFFRSARRRCPLNYWDGFDAA